MITIYAVWCEVNGKHYIGCTAGKPQKRWREHRCLLRAKKHSCISLQSDWSTLGEERFHLNPNIQLICWSEDVKVKREAELRWMDYFDRRGMLYNERKISFQPPPGAPAKAAAARVANGYIPSPESNLKRRLAQLGKPKNHGWKISETKQAQKLAKNK